MKRTEVTYRRPDAADLDRIGEIDRTERITTSYVQRGACLEERAVDWSASPWSSDGQGEHSVAHQRAECARPLAAGALGLCAFADERLVGIGLVTPQVRPCVAQLAFLYVSHGHRDRGIGAGRSTCDGTGGGGVCPRVLCERGDRRVRAMDRPLASRYA